VNFQTQVYFQADTNKYSIQNRYDLISICWARINLKQLSFSRPYFISKTLNIRVISVAFYDNRCFILFFQCREWRILRELWGSRSVSWKDQLLECIVVSRSSDQLVVLYSHGMAGSQTVRTRTRSSIDSTTSHTNLVLCYSLFNSSYTHCFPVSALF